MRSIWKYLLPVLILIYTWVVFVYRAQLPDFSDLQVYVTAGKKAALHQTVYDVVGHYQFKYSPYIVWIFGWTVGQMPWDTGKWIFYGLSFFAWVVFGVWCLREVQKRYPQLSLWTGGILLGLGVYCVPLRDELKLGQVNWIPALCLLGIAKLLTGKNQFWKTVLAGLLFAIAVQVKLYCLLLAPLFLRRTRWTVLFSTLVWFLFLDGILLAAVHGWDFMLSENLAWVQSLTHSTEGLLDTTYNVSMLGWLTRVQGSKIFWMVAVVFGAFEVWRVRRQDFFVGLSYGLLILLWINPLVWPYWVLLAFPATALTVAEPGLRRERALTFAFLAIWALAVHRQNNPWTRENALPWLIFAWIFVFRRKIDRLATAF